MKVAIIGAGISGLSCAYELYRHGIHPTIFEKKDFTGDNLINAVAMLNLFNRSYEKPVNYFSKKYHIKIKPLYQVKEIVMVSSRKEMSVKGNIGYIFARGREENSLENQITPYIKDAILLGTQVGVSDIKNQFDHVVAATGEDSAAKMLNVWTQSFNAFVRAAVVLGEFRTDLIKMWLNTKYAKNGYCYLIPNNEKQANLIMIINNISHEELDFYWKEFLSDEDISYSIIETRDFESNIGFVDQVQIDNVYLVGNAAGFIDDVLGFGTFGAIESGILAARSIAEGHDYNRLTRPLTKRIKKLHEFRSAINGMDNNGIDRMLSLLNIPGMKRITYGNPIFKVIQTAPLAKIFNLVKDRK